MELNVFVELLDGSRKQIGGMIPVLVGLFRQIRPQTA